MLSSIRVLEQVRPQTGAKDFAKGVSESVIGIVTLCAWQTPNNTVQPAARRCVFP